MRASTMLSSGSRRLAALFALIAVGLAVSLLPTADFIIRATGTPVKYAALSPVEPGFGVQQSLGRISSPIAEVRVWVAGRLGYESVRINASLVTSHSSSPIRQFAFDAGPAVEPRPYVLRFVSYEPPQDEDLVLQLAVSEDAEAFVTMGIAAGT